MPDLSDKQIQLLYVVDFTKVMKSGQISQTNTSANYK